LLHDASCAQHRLSFLVQLPTSAVSPLHLGGTEFSSNSRVPVAP
jgi:hypothetical protein